MCREPAYRKESISWLNTNTLIGCTDKRGTAWHWRAQEQGERSNHYPGAIPVEDVQDRLFGWQAESRRLAVELPAAVVDATHWEGGLPRRWAVVPDRQAICRSDDDTLLGIFGPGYTRHQYREWLLTTVADLLDDDLVISSAGLLRGGAIAWVEVSMPDTITTPKGWRSARTCWPPPASTAPSPPPTNAPSRTRVCDNTRELALSERGQEVKVKHSRHSGLQLAPARHALAMVHTLAADFAAEIAALCATPVSPAQWRGFLDRHVPRTDPSTSRPLEGRALTHADSKRSRLDELYQHDPRVAPWTGTAHGVLQAVNTYSQHEGVVRGDRAERNSLKTITGEFADVDRKTWQALKPVLAAA